MVFTLDTPDAPVLLAGDLLFAGSIGRVDLPGGVRVGDARLARPGGAAAATTPRVVHPGHGPSTTVGRERATNPFLQLVTEKESLS